MEEKADNVMTLCGQYAEYKVYLPEEVWAGETDGHI